jgi:hypothetical protein
MFSYELDEAMVAKLAAQNVHIEKHDDRTVVTFMHDVEMQSTGQDGSGISLTVGKTSGRRATIGYTPDGKGVWLQTQLAQYKEPKPEKRSRKGPSEEEIAAMIAKASAEAAAAAVKATLAAQAEQSAPSSAAPVGVDASGEMVPASDAKSEASTPKSKSDSKSKSKTGGKSRRRRLPQL